MEEKKQPQADKEKTNTDKPAKIKSDFPLSEKDEVKEAERNTNKLNKGK